MGACETPQDTPEDNHRNLWAAVELAASVGAVEMEYLEFLPTAQLEPVGPKPDAVKKSAKAKGKKKVKPAPKPAKKKRKTVQVKKVTAKSKKRPTVSARAKKAKKKARKATPKRSKRSR